MSTEHVWQTSRFTETKTCEVCGLVPLDEDDVQSSCNAIEHNEYTLLVEGAYEADIITDVDFNVIASNDPGSSPTTRTEWFDTLSSDAASDGQRYEVFAVHHGEHAVGVECECAQFETDHHPIWTRNVND